jgi:hypothetical protein
MPRSIATRPCCRKAGWTYNPARGRPDNAFNGGVAGTAASYAGACTGYTGFCSETAHQSRRSCTSVLGINFCGYNKVAFNGPGVPASRVRQIWNSGQTFNLNQYRALLASGVSIIASFPVYEGIMAAPATGIVSDYSMTMRNAAGDLVNGSYGGHLVQIVGFLSNEELSFPGSPVNIGGGGYFIIRNSWGCAADGGYYYVPADYVSTRFSTLEILDFDATRSARWSAEQVTPGGTSGLAIDPQGTSVVDLRVIGDLAGRFAITHPVANYVRLTVTSNRDGLLFDGQWLVNPPVGGSLFGNNLRVNLQTEGLRTLTLTARYGSQVVTATKDVIVLNSAPTVRFETSGAPQQGESFVVNAVVTDPNESDLTGLCNAMTWTVTAPDTIVSGAGCTRTIRFGAQGEREVRASTQDREGRAGSGVLSLFVQPPPVNPYPRITSAGVYSRDSLFISGTFVGCNNNLVASNAVIDLRQTGCKDQPVRAGSVALPRPGGGREPGQRGADLRLDVLDLLPQRAHAVAHADHARRRQLRSAAVRVRCAQRAVPLHGGRARQRAGGVAQQDATGVERALHQHRGCAALTRSARRPARPAAARRSAAPRLARGAFVAARQSGNLPAQLSYEVPGSVELRAFVQPSDRRKAGCQQHSSGQALRDH